MSSTAASATAAPAFTPLVRIVFVRAPIEKAFHRFTAEIGTWWPLASHSIGQANAETVTMETHLGGRIVERQKDGTTCTWGTITAWDPPHRIRVNFSGRRRSPNVKARRLLVIQRTLWTSPRMAGAQMKGVSSI